MRATTGLATAFAGASPARELVIEADEDVEEALDLMTENQMAVLPVINADGLVVGIVSCDDIVRGLGLRVPSPPGEMRRHGYSPTQASGCSVWPGGKSNANGMSGR